MVGNTGNFATFNCYSQIFTQVMKAYIRKTVFFTGLVLAIMSVMSFMACNRNKCNTVVCLNRGVCNDGACTCPVGYEGANCETEIRKKFTGNWRVFEKGSASLAKQYGVSVTNGEGVTDLLITNFNNYFHGRIRAYVEGTRIIIPVQRTEGKVVYGEGDLFTTVTYGQFGGITFRYIVQDSATLTKDDYGYEPAIDFSEPSDWNK